MKGNKTDIVNDFTILGDTKCFLFLSYTSIVGFAIIPMTEKKKRFAQEPPKVS